MSQTASLLVVVGALAWLGRVGAFAPGGVAPPLPSSRASAFAAPSAHRRGPGMFSSRVAFADAEGADAASTFDPLDCADGWDDAPPRRRRLDCASSASASTSASLSLDPARAVAAPVLALSTLVLGADASCAAAPLSEGDFDPNAFKPVCSASDSFYRFLQGSTRAVVGDVNFSEYGPLIAGGLLRIRLELCVVESFFNEAVGPFIKANGLSWILPLHETVETFLAGTIFALATTFILVGSTKLIQIIAFYGDLIVGGPCRLLGGFFFDRARGQPVTLDVSFFGFFKTRLVGPPVDFKEEELEKASGEGNLLDLDNVNLEDIPLLVVSGGVKVVGESAKVSRCASIIY